MTTIPRASRRTLLWNAALVHRLSGIGLALFLPLHFLVLGLGLEGAGRLDGFLRLTQLPFFRLAEGGLVFLLVVHLAGGLRVLAIEALPWFDGQKKLVLTALGVAVLAGLAFLLLVF